MNILIKDDYFKDAHLLRETAVCLDKKFYRVDNEFIFPPSGWKGQRSRPLRELKNKKLDKCDKNIFALCSKFFDLENFTYLYAPPEKKKPNSEFMITSYFHITTEETRMAFFDFSQDRFHKDFNTAVAGIVYLNPNPPPNSGTTILDGKNNRLINTENKFNRLVAYDGSRIHALSDVFGDSVETGRLTYTFFIHEKDFIDVFES